jgi:hypothetical protein
MQTESQFKRAMFVLVALPFVLAALTLRADPPAKAGFCLSAADKQPLYIDGKAGSQTLLGPDCANGRPMFFTGRAKRKVCHHPYLNVGTHCASRGGSR